MSETSISAGIKGWRVLTMCYSWWFCFLNARPLLKPILKRLVTLLSPNTGRRCHLLPSSRAPTHCPCAFALRCVPSAAHRYPPLTLHPPPPPSPDPPSYLASQGQINYSDREHWWLLYFFLLGFFVLYGFLFREGCGLVGELFSIAEYV